MIEKLKEFFETSTGKAVAGVLAVGVAGLAIYVFFFSSFSQSDAARLSTDRVFIDAENDKPFDYTIKLGDKMPVVSPFSGKNTGYEAEQCYWNKDGTPKKTPTYVLIKERQGKPGPSFCPDCGRLVVGLNPAPGPGVTPPPTEAEVKAKRSR